MGVGLAGDGVVSTPRQTEISRRLEGQFASWFRNQGIDLSGHKHS
jgi:hypothetical protein